MPLDARPDERFVKPSPATRAKASRQFALAAACLLVHLSGLYIVYRLDRPAPSLRPPEEIPVEIVVEAPPPPPPPPKPPQPAQPPPPTIDEKPATDAPRAVTAEQTERDAPDDATHAPTPAKPSDPPPAAGRIDPPEETASRQSIEDKPNAEAVAPAAPRRAEKERQASQPKPADDPRPQTLGDQFASFTPMPDYKIGGAAKQTPVSGGQAKATYLSILYGMIMGHMRTPEKARASALTGEVSFTVDGTGALIHEGLKRGSGMPAFDAAALAAVKAAAPFPVTPNGVPVGLTFTYSTQ